MPGTLILVILLNPVMHILLAYFTDKVLRLRDGKSVPKVPQVGGPQSQFSLPLKPILSSLCSSHGQLFLKYHRDLFVQTANIN